MTVVLTLFGRPGCHLCDEARERLLQMRRRGSRFELREVDIEDDERLHRELLERIPVIEIDGERVSELIPDYDAIVARLATVDA
jgi:glutaredoxin